MRIASSDGETLGDFARGADNFTFVTGRTGTTYSGDYAYGTAFILPY